MSISIADLPVVDDLDVPVNQEDYVDQANPSPVKPGNYRFAVVKAAPRTNKDGSLALADNKFPTIVLEQVKIVEPVDAERQVGVFTDIRFKPFTRKGPNGVDVPASDVVDLLRAFDETVNIEGFEHMRQLLQQQLENGGTFLGQIAWTGYDKAYVEQAFAELGGKENVTKEVANSIYGKARKSTKDFTVNGKLQATITGASGATIEARPKITRYFPSNTEFGKGKDERGRNRIELGAFKK